MAILRKKSANVRPASGPRRSRRPSCATPAASEANTSGITTKNNRRRKTCPSGSKTFVETFRMNSNEPGEYCPRPRVARPATTPKSSP